MKTLIYQYWDGKITEACRAGVANMKHYAESIGADYIFEENPAFIKDRRFGNYSPHYGAFKPIFDKKMQEYDKVLFADTDIFAVEGLEENIFDAFVGNFGICTEPFQPKQRQITLGRITSAQDELWASTVEREFGGKMPRTDDLVRIYNTGVVLYSKRGMQQFRDRFASFDEYVACIKRTNLNSFYMCDQPYLHAMLFSNDVVVQEMDNGWNSYIHYISDTVNRKRRLNDCRDENTKFVHQQLAGADNFTAQTCYRVTNLPIDEWDIQVAK